MSHSVEELISQTHSLVVDDDPDDDWELNDSISSSANTILLGKIVSKKPTSKPLLKAQLERMWNPGPGWQLQILSTTQETTTFKAKFKDKTICSSILARDPWLFSNGFLILAPWPESGVWQTISLDTISLWGRVTNIPPKLLTPKKYSENCLCCWPCYTPEA